MSRKIPVQPRNEPRVSPLPVGPTARSRPGWLFGVAVALSLFVLGTYARLYEPRDGWTRLINFGSDFATDALPRLKRNPHRIVEGTGMDGQFYAQLAIDPSVQDPAFDHALDNPAYRSRRIGLPALAFCLGGGKPRRILQIYAVSNLIFWFGLLGTLAVLFRPWTGKQVLCFGIGLVSFGVVTSLEESMVDLPASTMIFFGLILGAWGRYAAFAAATLTRETSALAALGCLELRRPFTFNHLKRQVGLLALAIVPFLGWLVYISHRFDGLHSAAGSGNFAFPLQAMAGRFFVGVQDFAKLGLNDAARAAGPFGWLYLDDLAQELLTVAAFFFQGLYLVLRREAGSAVWRTGIAYVVLCSILGPGVWGWTGAAARVLIPMTLCFYLVIAKERDDRWFWPFLVLGSLSVPYGWHHFWTFT